MNLKKTAKGIVFYCGNYDVKRILFANLNNQNILIATIMAEMYKRHFSSFEHKKKITIRYSEAIALAIVLENTELDFLASEIKLLLRV